MKNKLIINLGSVLVVLILVSFVFMSHWQMTRVNMYDHEQEVTFNIIQNLDRLLEVLRDVRRNQRSFSESGEEKYLTLYNNALKEAERELELLEKMANNNSWLQKRLAAIEFQVKGKLAEHAKQLKVTGRKDCQIATDGDTARAKMDEIHRQVASAKEEAVRRMRLLTAEEETEFNRMVCLLVINSIVICTLVITVFLMLKREIAGRIRMNEHVVLLQEQGGLALSREVHDDIGQNLTALKLDLTLIENRLLPTDNEVAERLAEMRSTLDQLLAKTHDITAKLRPPLLDNLGLAAAIEWQVDEFRRRSGIECHLMLNEGIKVPDRYVALTILRILQEALTNVVRHARATEISISMCERGDEFILEISDNGCGINTKEMDSLNSYGLMGMRERASLCNGTLAIRGNSGNGTIVTLMIPADALGEKK